MSLKGKVIVITGASRGLGKAIAQRLVKEKAKLALIARTKKDLEVLKDELKSECEIFVCDVSNEVLVKLTVKKIIQKFGRVDILINNAGIWYEGSTDKHSLEKIKELFLINSIGPIYLTREVLPYMKKQESGQVLNISSSAGTRPDGGWGVYTSSKYALRGFTDSLKMELEGTGIKVMGFYPGGMNTTLFTTAGFKKENEPWMMKKEDIAEIIVFMLKTPDDVTMHHVEVRKQNR